MTDGERRAMPALKRRSLAPKTVSSTRALLRIYARLKGEIAKDKSAEVPIVDVAEALKYMDHISAIVRILGADFDPDALAAIKVQGCSRARLAPNVIQVSRALILLYARLKGELNKETTGLRMFVDANQARIAIDHIVGLMPLLRVDFDPDAIDPISTRPHNALVVRGLRSQILALLKEKRDWMSYREIACEILARNGKKSVGSRTMRVFLQKVREAVWVLHDVGAIEREKELPVGGIIKAVQRLRLSRSLFRPD